MKYISFSAVLLVLAVAAILPTNSQVISSVLEPQVVPQGHGCFWSGTSPFCFGKCGKFYHTVATDRRGNGKKCVSGFKTLCCPKTNVVG
ncbi:hypothetical protein GHT06_022716 [Daphnia sinensis]|uniref:Single domain-containing protein n=1 Tax=Daphnia sinensis TaxID=1820382 RepID=A0AAD5KHD6_9CRUS|nr:hypothetical protein GHT06_022716 [Daphnia sinensis]